MLVRSLRLPAPLLLFVVFCIILAWQVFNHDPSAAVPALQKSPATPLPPPAERKPDAAVQKDEKKTPRIALVTFVTEERSYLHISLKTKDHYVRRHGYDLIVDYEAHPGPRRGPVWWKFNMVERLIQQDKYDWIWWLDFDTLITNTSIPVTDIIASTLVNATNADNLDYLFTHDCNDLNLGSFIVRSRPSAVAFLHAIYAVEARELARDPDAQLSEQDAITMLLNEDAGKRATTTVVPQWMLNAFPEEIGCYAEPKTPWQRGFLLVHFAGAWAHVEGEDPTGQLMRKYQDEVEWGDWKTIY